MLGVRDWDWDPYPPSLLSLENVYRLKSVRKGRKRHFMKHIRMCFEILNVAKKQDFSLQPSKQVILLFMGCVPVQKLLWCWQLEGGGWALTGGFLSAQKPSDFCYLVQHSNLVIKTNTI